MSMTALAPSRASSTQDNRHWLQQGATPSGCNNIWSGVYYPNAVWAPTHETHFRNDNSQIHRQEEFGSVGERQHQRHASAPNNISGSNQMYCYYPGHLSVPGSVVPAPVPSQMGSVAAAAPGVGVGPSGACMRAPQLSFQQVAPMGVPVMGPPQQFFHPYYTPVLTTPVGYMGPALNANSMAFAPRLAPLVPVSLSVPSSPTSQVSPFEYNEEIMAEFLASMSFGVMSPYQDAWTPHQHQEFQRFVTSILRAMRLPKSTTILSLVYLSHRWSLGQIPSALPSGGADIFYLHFVVSLVLANKMHDDNTFTNASWCQATGIGCKEITRTEANWLDIMKWDLNVGNGSDNGWAKWHQCWQAFESQKLSQPPSPAIVGPYATDMRNDTLPLTGPQSPQSWNSTDSQSLGAQNTLLCPIVAPVQAVQVHEPPTDSVPSNSAHAYAVEQPHEPSNQRWNPQLAYSLRHITPPTQLASEQAPTFDIIPVAAY